MQNVKSSPDNTVAKTVCMCVHQIFLFYCIEVLFSFVRAGPSGSSTGEAWWGGPEVAAEAEVNAAGEVKRQWMIETAQQ